MKAALLIFAFLPALILGTITTVTVAPGGNLKFDPAVVNITVGDTVAYVSLTITTPPPSASAILKAMLPRWKWAATGHNVVGGSNCQADDSFCSTADASPCSGTGTNFTGTTYTHVFNKAGTYPYFCIPHCGSNMVGVVYVHDAVATTPAPSAPVTPSSATSLAVCGLLSVGLALFALL